MARRRPLALLRLELSLRFGALALILVLGVVVAVLVWAVQRSSKRPDAGNGGADIVPYLILAVAMGVAGFALAELASTAFPGERFVFDPAQEVATSLSALVVATPFLVYFWRRQAQRRETYPGSPGWTIYLTLIEVVFLTAFVIATVLFLNGLFDDGSTNAWTGVVVFGAILVFHEWAVHATPPHPETGELRRVFGSAIGLITATIGLSGVFVALFTRVFDLAGTFGLESFHPWLAMLIVGAPVWWYRWLRPWEAEPGVPRLTWAVLVSGISLATALGAATAIVVLSLEYILLQTPPAGQHFEGIPVPLALVLTGIPVWLVHRRTLRAPGGSPLQVYRYAMAALGLLFAVSMAAALTTAALDRTLIVGAGARDILTFAVVLIVSLAVWLGFERRAASVEATSTWPRRLYTLGVGLLVGLVAAGALITTLFILLRRILDSADGGSVVVPLTLFVYSGAAAWYLLSAYAQSRDTVADTTPLVPPFEVTIICSHPGLLATRFPEQARLRVIYRGDDLGVIGDGMADEIVASVANQPSLVWVDEDGFRVAPLRAT